MLNFVRSLSGNIYLNAAKKLKIDFKVINYINSIVVFELNGRKHFLIKNILGTNNNIGAKIAKDKYLTSIALESIEIGPKCKRITSKRVSKVRIFKRIFKIAEEKNWQIVIKPSKFSLSKGVYILPRSPEKLRKIVDKLIDEYKVDSIIVEDYFKAENEYRLIVYKGKLIDIIERDKAFVEGDGKSTIQELVNKKNDFRVKYGFKPIKIDSRVKKLLEDQELKPDTVLPYKQKAILKNIHDLALGGERYRVPINKAHKDYFKICKQIFNLTNLNFIGIDLMTRSDISEKPTKETAYINEINSAPTPDVQYFADLLEGKPYKGAMLVLKNWLAL